MAESVEVLDSKFKKSGSLKSPIGLSDKEIKVAVVHQVVKAALASRRQGNACTKTRGQVRGGGAKPFKQKGTGRARQGSRRSPLLVGGGTIFGPKTRSYKQKVNKKTSLVAINSVLADKHQAGKLTVVDKIESSGKTGEMFKLLGSKKLLPALVVTASKESPALRAVRNLAQAKGMAVDGFSVYEAVRYENLVIEKEALENLFKRFE